MIVQVHTDKPISESTTQEVVATVESGLELYRSRLTRAEVYLKNVGRTHPDNQLECKLEVRPASRDPIVVSHHAASLDEVVEGAAEKMNRLLHSLFDKLDSHSGPSASGLPT